MRRLIEKLTMIVSALLAWCRQGGHSTRHRMAGILVSELEPRWMPTTGFVGSEGFSQVYDETLFKTPSYYSSVYFPLTGLEPGDDVRVRLDLTSGPIAPGPTTFSAGRYREADLASLTGGGTAERIFTTDATSETVTTVARNYDRDDFARARVSVRMQPNLKADRLGNRSDGGGVEFDVRSTRNFLPKDVSVVLYYVDELGNRAGVAWSGKLGRGTAPDITVRYSILFSMLAVPGRGPDGRPAVKLVGVVNPEGFPEPSRSDNVATLALPDFNLIVASQANSPKQIRLDYSLGGSLPRDLTVQVFRSSDMTFDPADEAVAEGKIRPTGNSSGSVTVNLDQLPQITAARPNLLVVVNPKTWAYEGNPDNNTARLRVLTLGQLRSTMPTNSDPSRWLVPLANAMLEFGILTPAQQAAFLANVAHETNDLRHIREGDYLNPSSETARINALKPLYTTRPDIINPNANGPHWYGRGPLQLTSRKNYEDASLALFGNKSLATNPDLVASDLTVSARASAWYWGSKVRGSDGKTLNQLADSLSADEFRSLSVLINGVEFTETGKQYPKGWNERVLAYRLALQSQFLGILPTETAIRVGGWNLPNWVQNQTATQRRNSLDDYLIPFRRIAVGERVSIWLTNGKERRIVMGQF